MQRDSAQARLGRGRPLNTDNPHVHVLIRGRGDDGEDLVISRAYISGISRSRRRAGHPGAGPRSEQEIRSALEKEVEAERWTSLDRHSVMRPTRARRRRPSAGAPSEDPTLRRLMVAGTKLERLGLADRWRRLLDAQTGIEGTLRDLSIRATFHQDHASGHGKGRARAGGVYVCIAGRGSGRPGARRLVARGLHDELTGSAYAIVEGVDGRTHHVRFRISR